MADKRITLHRQRFRDRFLAGEEESRSDEGLLELLLTYAIRRKDVQPIAEELLRVFGNLNEVLGTSSENLEKIKGLGQASITLIKIVNFIKNKKFHSETVRPLTSGKDANQIQPFQDLPSDSATSKPLQIKPQPVTEGQSSKKRKSSSEHNKGNQESKAKRTVPIPQQIPSNKKSIRRKLQVSNSYLLEFDQLARVLNFLSEQKESKRIKRKLLQENTGLAERQVEGLVSIGTAMGLIKPNVQTLSPTGLIIAIHDLFLETPATLEWCHYRAAGSYQNLIWFEVFNHLLPEESAMTQEDWKKYFQDKLKGQYTDKTLKGHVHKEIRFVIDVYTERNFKKLELLQRSSDERLYRRRYTRFSPLVLSAMIYDFCAARETHLFQVAEMAVTPGSPAVVFGLDVASFRQQIEELHDRGWLRYETTHNLDQIRLKQGFTAIRFLSAFYEDRDPREDTKPSLGGIFQ